LGRVFEYGSAVHWMKQPDPLSLLYLSAEEVAEIGPSMAEIIDALVVAFREKGEGHVEMPPKPGIHPGGEDNFIHAMPAYIPALRSAGLKWVSGFPGNTNRGLPYIAGLLIFNDVETGLPLAVMDGGWITAMRTGAASAVAASYLARAESSTIGILGCGVQGRANLEGLREVLPLARALAYDIDPEVARRYAREMRQRFDMQVEVVDEPRRAVTGCDVVVTAGPILKHPHGTIKAGWLEPGGFASLVDYDSYWHTDALQEVDKICTDDLAQFLAHQEAGYFQHTPEIHADIGELATGRKPGRQSPAERILAINLGLAMDDMAVAPLVYQRAVEAGLGTWLTR
jgi:ornithine cyclodeaminase/alanine dehydrogenase-like protein (mu-crystallin family)